jgi:hypothetical protein
VAPAATSKWEKDDREAMQDTFPIRATFFAENEGEEDPSTGVPKLVDKIKAFSAKYSSV